MLIVVPKSRKLSRIKEEIYARVTHKRYPAIVRPSSISIYACIRPALTLTQRSASFTIMALPSSTGIIEICNPFGGIPRRVSIILIETLAIHQNDVMIQSKIFEYDKKGSAQKERGIFYYSMSEQAGLWGKRNFVVMEGRT